MVRNLVVLTVFNTYSLICRIYDHYELVELVLLVLVGPADGALERVGLSGDGQRDRARDGEHEEVAPVRGGPAREGRGGRGWERHDPAGVRTRR